MESHSSTRLVVVAALCLLVLLVTSTQAGAQPQPAQAEPGDTRLQVGVQGLVGVALGDFSDNVDTTGGVNVDFTYALSGSSFRIGGGVGVLLYDRGTWLSDVSTLPAEWRFRHQRQSVSFGILEVSEPHLPVRQRRDLVGFRPKLYATRYQCVVRLLDILGCEVDN